MKNQKMEKKKKNTWVYSDKILKISKIKREKHLPALRQENKQII